MNKIDIKRISISIFSATCLILYGFTAQAGNRSEVFPNIPKSSQTAKPVRDFHGEKTWNFSAPDTSKKIISNNGRRVASDGPVLEFNDLGSFDYLTAPDGSTWFYTTEYDIVYEEISEWYSEPHITSYTFTIYDSTFKKVGEIKDKISLAADETKVAHAVLDPSLSKNFFNSDDKMEAMVYLAMNTSAALNYEVNYYNKIYSIGGEKDEEGNDVSLMTIPGRCVDAFNAGNSQEEEFYYTFAEDYYPDFGDPSLSDYEDFLKAVNSAKTILKIYGPLSENKNPEPVYTKEIFLTRVPGDTTDGIYLITKTFEGVPYFIFSQYEKPYFLDPTGFATDENATPDNTLLIETYCYNGSMNLISSTRIPVELTEVEDQVAYTFYSIGSVAWAKDVDMVVNGTPSSPAYIVAVDFTTAANLDEVSSSYRVYSNDGKIIRSIAEETDGIALLHSAGEDQPHAMLITVDADEKYSFHFTDLYSGNKLFKVDQSNGGDPITAVCERVKGADGKYKYVFEMLYEDKDTEGNNIKRMAWFNQDGSFDRIDRINMLSGVQYSTVNLYPGNLSPFLYDDDEAMEYAVLVKRTSGATTENEFLICDDDGKLYARFTKDDGKGLPYTFTVLFGEDRNRLQMVYRNDELFNVSIFDLPFAASAYADYGNPAIEGEWEFVLDGHYLGEYSINQFTEKFDAVLEGNIVRFLSSGSPYDIVGEFIGKNTLLFTKRLVGSSTSIFGLYQSPYINEETIENLEDLKEESFTAVYDPTEDTLTFPVGCGLEYGLFSNETGELSFWQDAFDIISASRVENGSASVERPEFGEEVDTIYFDLQGRPINNPQKGIFIRKSGNKVEKIIM